MSLRPRKPRGGGGGAAAGGAAVGGVGGITGSGLPADVGRLPMTGVAPSNPPAAACPAIASATAGRRRRRLGSTFAACALGANNTRPPAQHALASRFVRCLATFARQPLRRRPLPRTRPRLTSAHHRHPLPCAVGLALREYGGWARSSLLQPGPSLQLGSFYSPLTSAAQVLHRDGPLLLRWVGLWRSSCASVYVLVGAGGPGHTRVAHRRSWP